MKVKVLDRPPIREAIFEVLLDFPSPITFEALEGFEEAIIKHFPNKKEIFQVQGQIMALIDDASSQLNRTKFGIAYIDQSGNTMIQIRLNGFSFIQLNKTYKSWDSFHPLSFEWFYKFTNYIGAISANRISLRFVNEIEIPLPISDLNDYITTAPNWNLELPFNSLFMRLELPSAKYDALAIIQEGVAPPFDKNLKLFFDIDVLKNTQDKSPISIDKETLKGEFDKLREFKNYIFFGSFTDKAEIFFKN